MYTFTSETAAGVTPGMRDAWPTVRRRILVIFSSGCRGFQRSACQQPVRLRLPRLPCEGVGPRLVLDEPDSSSVRSEAGVGIINAQVQAKLGAACEHPKWPVCTFSNNLIAQAVVV